MHDDLEQDLARRASQSWDAHRDLWQTIVNARPIPPLRVQTIPPDPIPVQVRIVWERDGLELVDAVATGWTSRLVLVDLDEQIPADSTGKGEQVSREVKVEATSYDDARAQLAADLPDGWRVLWVRTA